MKPFISQITAGALVADAYCLGAHWIYDEQTLRTLDVDWQTLNDPRGQWHPNRRAGQYTHYGDQLAVLAEYIQEHDHFALGPYMKKWFHYMRNYDGYMDGATRNTIDNMLARNPLPCGFGSEDLSVAGRIGPLLAVSGTESTFLENVDLFVKATHFTQVARESAAFCARLLWRLQQGESVDSGVASAVDASSPWIQKVVDLATEKTDTSTVDAIRAFGPDCNAHAAMPGAVFLLLKHRDDYETAMIKNAKAGGDSSARGMVAGMLMTAAFGIDIIPTSWLQGVQNKIWEK